MSIGDTHLPELPSLDEMREAAEKRRAFYQGVVDRAQAEVDKAQTVLDGLAGGRGKRPKPRGGPHATVGADTYRAVLAKLAGHNYASSSTLAGSADCHTTTALRAMQQAVREGHATFERRGKRRRFQITEAGQEFVTRPDGGPR